MAKLPELFVVCFLTIGVVCSRTIDSFVILGDYERIASLTIGPSAGFGIDEYDKYPDAEDRVGDLRISPTAQKQILQSSASVMKKGEQDLSSGSKGRKDSLKHLRTIRSPPRTTPSPTVKPTKRRRCYLKICNMRSVVR